MAQFLPISFAFVASAAAIQAKSLLMRIEPSRTGQGPNWNKATDNYDSGATLTPPITDKSYWSDRYVLTEITFERANGQLLTVNDATVTLSRAKHIVKTQLVGLNGTIKEYISNGDYDIGLTVGIVAVNESGGIVDEYPNEGIATVRDFLEENASLRVTSTLFDIFGIDQVVVDSFNLKQTTGSNRQEIQVKMSSDQDYIIKRTEY